MRIPASSLPRITRGDPTTAYRGLNLLAIRDIRRREELTLDYAACCDETLAAFQCQCGSPKCRGEIASPVR
jgi:D-alanine-D-alanine ligase